MFHDGQEFPLRSVGPAQRGTIAAHRLVTINGLPLRDATCLVRIHDHRRPVKQRLVQRNQELVFLTVLEGFFEPLQAHGQVDAARLITDRETGRPRGFGFVEMSNDEEARAAIAELDGKELDGRDLKVNEARPKADRGGGGGRPKRDRW